MGWGLQRIIFDGRPANLIMSKVKISDLGQVKRTTTRVHLLLLIIMLSIPCNTLAFEAFVIGPGSRATAMAGVFSAQADDNTAIWYNPGGLQRKDLLASDFTVEFGPVPAGNEFFESDTQASGAESNVKYLGYYQNRIPFWQGASDNVGFGIAYFTPYELTFDIDTRRSVLDPTPFGSVQVNYRQFSVMLSARANENLSYGGTFDWVWTSVNCQDYSPCVDDGPYGYGFTGGLFYRLYKSEFLNINVAGVWRSRASLGYGSTSRSGLDSQLDKYVPDRPETFNISLGVQHFTSWAYINYNFMYEQVMWDSAVDSELGPLDSGVSDYNNIGIGVELGWPMGEGQALSFRAGIKKSDPESSDISPSVDTLAFGMGYGFDNKHFIDVGINMRSVESVEQEPDEIISLSYSLQN